MRITKGDKTIDIPSWALFVGALVVEEVAGMVCQVVNNKNILKAETKIKGGSQK